MLVACFIYSQFNSKNVQYASGTAEWKSGKDKPHQIQQCYHPHEASEQILHE